MGKLDRMTQFKDKAGKNAERAGLGLYAYPVLMAADILLYHATHVPVGEDQVQHVELARDIASTFNHRYGQDFFPLPETVLRRDTMRIMSLRDGTKKMSKSDESDLSRINLIDDADTIAQKLKKAKTDTAPFPSSPDELSSRPEVKNLINIYAALTGQSIDLVINQFAGQNFAPFKTALIDVAVEKLAPITKRMNELLAAPDEIDRVLANGATRAQKIAAPILANTQKIMGF
jgi:tryptophanyl-tRNA synthetase